MFTLGNPDTLFFRWHAGVPEFHTDFYEYVWQRHTEPPGFESVKFSVHSAPLNSLNVFILFDSTVPNSKGTESLRPFHKYLRIRKEKLPCSTTQPHTIETEFISSIYAIFVIIIADTKSFLDDLCERLTQLVRSGGRNLDMQATNHPYGRLASEEKIHLEASFII